MPRPGHQLHDCAPIQWGLVFLKLFSGGQAKGKGLQGALIAVHEKNLELLDVDLRLLLQHQDLQVLLAVPDEILDRGVLHLINRKVDVTAGQLEQDIGVDFSAAYQVWSQFNTSCSLSFIQSRNIYKTV